VRLQLSRPTTVSTCAAAVMTRAAPGSCEPGRRGNDDEGQRAGIAVAHRHHFHRRRGRHIHGIAGSLEDVGSAARHTVILTVEHDACAPREDHHQPFGARSQHQQIVGPSLDQVERDELCLLAGANQ